MNDNWLERTELLLGKEKLSQIRDAHVLVVGLGGVGAYAAEMIARAGVGRMTDRKSTRLNSKSPCNLVCRLLLEKKKKKQRKPSNRTRKRATKPNKCK